MKFLILLFATALSCNASIVLNIYAERLQNQFGATLAAGSLLQLIDLGADGVFNQINIADGSSGAGTLTQWVSGDDTLIDQSFGSSEFTSTRAFDLIEGPDNAIGRMDRPFDLTIAANTKIGLRWWPTLTASVVQTNFDSFLLTWADLKYGEYTRQSSPINGGNLWIAPADGSLPETFDALATGTAGGANSETDGLASQTIIPEVSTTLLAAAGITYLASRRKRKSRAGEFA